MESEQATPVDSIKDLVQSSVKVLEFDKHLKKAWRNVVEIKMKTIVQKTLMIKIADYYNALTMWYLGVPQSRLYLKFKSHWVPHSFGLVLNRSKDLCKLLQITASKKKNV